MEKRRQNKPPNVCLRLLNRYKITTLFCGIVFLQVLISVFIHNSYLNRFVVTNIKLNIDQLVRTFERTKELSWLQHEYDRKYHEKSYSTTEIDFSQTSIKLSNYDKQTGILSYEVYLFDTDGYPVLRGGNLISARAISQFGQVVLAETSFSEQGYYTISFNFNLPNTSYHSHILSEKRTNSISISLLSSARAREEIERIFKLEVPLGISVYELYDGENFITNCHVNKKYLKHSTNPSLQKKKFVAYMPLVKSKRKRDRKHEKDSSVKSLLYCLEPKVGAPRFDPEKFYALKKVQNYAFINFLHSKLRTLWPSVKEFTVDVPGSAAIQQLSARTMIEKIKTLTDKKFKTGIHFLGDVGLLQWYTYFKKQIFHMASTDCRPGFHLGNEQFIKNINNFFHLLHCFVKDSYQTTLEIQSILHPETCRKDTDEVSFIAHGQPISPEPDERTFTGTSKFEGAGLKQILEKRPNSIVVLGLGYEFTTFGFDYFENRIRLIRSSIESIEKESKQEFKILVKTLDFRRANPLNCPQSFSFYVVTEFNKILTKELGSLKSVEMLNSFDITFALQEQLIVGKELRTNLKKKRFAYFIFSSHYFKMVQLTM